MSIYVHANSMQSANAHSLAVQSELKPMRMVSDSPGTAYALCPELGARGKRNEDRDVLEHGGWLPLRLVEAHLVQNYLEARLVADAVVKRIAC